MGDATTSAALRERPPRTWLLVPGLRADTMLAKALASGADAVVLDLEAATAPAERERAREVVRALRPPPGAVVFVRVNLEPADAMRADVAAAVAMGAAGIFLPRVTTAEQVRAAGRALDAADERTGDRRAIVPMVETALAVLTAVDIAAADPRVVAIALGGEDLAADLGATRTPEGAELAVARGLVVIAAAAAGCGAIDTPWLDLRDPDGAAGEAGRMRLLGFTGKFAIHPAQVGPINAAFTPGPAEIERARGIVAAMEAALRSGDGIAVYDGKMIDDPVARAARRALARASLGAVAAGGAAAAPDRPAVSRSRRAAGPG